MVLEATITLSNFLLKLTENINIFGLICKCFQLPIRAKYFLRKTFSSFTHPHVAANLHDFFFYGTRTMDPIVFSTE